MSFFKSKKQSKEARKRYENKLMLAKTSPEHIFDLSECELFAIPYAVFTQCRVLLTESLILHSNWLKTISPTKDGGKLTDFNRLKILDLHNNKLKTLPSDLGVLTNLQVLNIENNQLTEIPASVGELKKLQSLLARDNLLNCLPNTIKGLSALRTLDIGGTNKVYYLPKTLCHVQTLEALMLSNPALMEYPPAMVAVEGLEAIQKCICKDCGMEYLPPSTALASVISTQTDGPAKTSIDNSLVSASAIEQYQRAKDQKLKQQLELERQLSEEQKINAFLTTQAKQDKAKSEAYIRMESVKFTQTLQEQQVKKDRERAEMVKMLKQVEQEANSLLKKLLSDKSSSDHQRKLLEELESQRLQQEELFRVSKEDLDQQRKDETLAAMEMILAENAQYGTMINQYLGEKNLAMRKAQQSIGNDATQMNEQIERQGKTQEKLVKQILEEEQLQKEAFSVLMFQHDAVQSRIMDEIGELEKQLTNLSLVEVKKNKLKMDQDQELLKNIRNELTDLLVQLLKEKDRHEEMMRQRLIEMEQQREDDQIDFWLVQYQKLLDTKPQVLLQKEHGLDVQIVKLLRRTDAEHHVPGFARHKITMDNLTSLDDVKLRSIGVFEIGLRQNILKEIELLIANQKLVSTPDVITPDASTPSPPLSPSTSTTPPSAPPAASDDDIAIENECVVCMDQSSDCVLLPCGHVCVCHNCATTLRQCPMCRKQITQKIKIYRSS